MILIMLFSGHENESKMGNDLEEGKLYDMTNIDGTQSIAPHLLSQ